LVAASIRKARECSMRSPTEVLAAILKNPTDIDNVRSLKIMPWAWTSKGSERIVKTFLDVARFWQIEAFDTEALFGSTEFAAMFGRFTCRSTVIEKTVTSPFAVFAKVADGRCTYLWRTLLPRRPRSAAEGTGSSAAIRMARR
jgi:uncharacterized protein